MTKIIFLIPPSEGKNKGGEEKREKLSFAFKKPHEIAIRASEKDLKCSGARYTEGIELNKKCINGISENYNQATQRYSGVMYNAIDYESMNQNSQSYFNDHFIILSGMYGLLKPTDIIGNYKLPIEAKGLLTFWGDEITKQLNTVNPKYIVNLLPISYGKMIDFDGVNSNIIHVNFFTKKDGLQKKMTHGVKKVKGEWIRKICEDQGNTYENFWKDSYTKGEVHFFDIIV